MTYLVSGIFLWIVVHLFPSVAPAARERLVSRLGEHPYKGAFSLLILGALALMIYGWRHSVPVHVYLPAATLQPLGMLLTVVGFVLIVAASFPTRIKRVVRHPQLSGVLLWALAHLMLNGDSRSVTLFSALGAWCVVSMLTINRRDGPREQPAVPGWGTEVAIVAIALVLVALVVYFHQYLSGVPLLG
jgi:uncharacterized membrane protein